MATKTRDYGAGEPSSQPLLSQSEPFFKYTSRPRQNTAWAVAWGLLYLGTIAGGVAAFIKRRVMDLRDERARSEGLAHVHTTTVPCSPPAAHAVARHGRGSHRHTPPAWHLPRNHALGSTWHAWPLLHAN